MRVPPWFATALFLFSGCSNHSLNHLRAMSDHVEFREIQVYAAWLKHGKPGTTHYVLNYTIPFSKADKKCVQVMETDGVPIELVHDLSSLGQATYPITPALASSVAIMTPSLEHLYAYPAAARITAGGFSRVAFSADGTQALFEEYFGLRQGEKWGGGQDNALLGTRKGDDWKFRVVGCIGILD